MLPRDCKSSRTVRTRVVGWYIQGGSYPNYALNSEHDDLGPIQNSLGSRPVSFEIFLRLTGAVLINLRRNSQGEPLTNQPLSVRRLNFMKMTDLFLAELEQEAAATRRVLE